MSKKILIIGNSAKEYSLAKKLSENNEVYVAPGNDAMKEFATCVDIREDATTELLEFVMETGIDMTIPTSTKALSTNIVEILNNNNQPVFAPSLNASEIICDKCSVKKLLYKLKIPTPKFGIFDKQNVATDYIKNLKQPFVIKTNEASSAVILTSQKIAKSILESVFTQKSQKVLVEDFVWGTPFTFYVATDGYKALPIGSSIVYKHSLEGDGGQLTNGMGACAPNYKLSFKNEDYLMNNVITPLLEYLETSDAPYIGILGVNGFLAEDGSIQVIGLQTFMQDSDCSAILELLDIDLIKLFNSCIIGSFSDEMEYIPQKDFSATSIVLTCKNKENKENIISGLEDLDESIKIDFYPQTKKNKYLEYEAEKGLVLVLTATSRTAASATSIAYQEIKNISFNGMSYRKDICKPVKTEY